MQERNAFIERDVNRLHERDQLEAEIIVTKIKISIAKYQQALQEYMDMKPMVEDAKLKYIELAERQAPLQKEKKNIREKIERLHTKESQFKANYEKGVGNLRRDLETLEQAEEDMDTTKKKISSLKRRQVTQEAEIACAERAVATAEQVVYEKELDLKNRELLDSDGNLQESSAQKSILFELKKISEKMAECKQSEAQVKGDIIELKRENYSVCQKREQIDRNIVGLDNIRNQRLETLAGIHRPTATAVEWLRMNAGDFKEKVFEPIVLEIGVSDIAYARAAESLIGFTDLKTFVTLNEDDYYQFKAQVIDKQRLAVNVVYYNPRSNSAQQGKFSANQVILS